MSERIDSRILERIKACPKIKISIAAVKNEISEIRRDNPGVSLNAAACEFAKRRGVNLMRYLGDTDRTTLSYIRESPQHTIAKEENKIRSIKVKQNIPTDVPYLTSADISNAEKMSVTYIILYCFENSVRRFIIEQLEKAYGPNWWEDKIQDKIKKEADINRNQEKDKRWHATRGAHPIYYLTMNSLRKIITDQWPLLKKVIREDQTWITSRLNEITDSRNIIAHHNPLPKREVERIILYFDDWKKQMKI